MTTVTEKKIHDVLVEALASPDLELAVERRTDGVPMLGRLSSVGRRVVARNAAAALDDALDIDLLTVAKRAWTNHDRLIAAGYRTAAGGAPEHIELGKHVITSTHAPTVEILLAERRALTVRFSVVLKLQFPYLLAGVRDGQLVGLDTGPCRLTASLACEEVPIPPTVSTSLRLAGRVDLGDGIPLVPASFLPKPGARATVAGEAPTQVLRLPR